MEGLGDSFVSCTSESGNTQRSALLDATYIFFSSKWDIIHLNSVARAEGIGKKIIPFKNMFEAADAKFLRASKTVPGGGWSDLCLWKKNVSWESKVCSRVIGEQKNSVSDASKWSPGMKVLENWHPDVLDIQRLSFPLVASPQMDRTERRTSQGLPNDTQSALPCPSSCSHLY